MKTLAFRILPVAVGLSPLQGQLVNPGFETLPIASGWTAIDVTADPGMNSSTTAARLPFNTSATLSQSFPAKSDFTLDVDLKVAGNTTAQSFRILLDTSAGNVIELSGVMGNALQLTLAGSPVSITSIASGNPFVFAGNQQVRFRIIGRGIGGAGASYDIAWSNPGTVALVHAVRNIGTFSTSTPSSGINRIRFDRVNTAAHSYTVDDVTLANAAAVPPAADYQITLPPTPKIVNISGVYPHLAVTNSSKECGIGAVVPWQGDLWAVTYAPHLPGGSDDKLYQILPDLTRITRPESIGGTPANRFIHAASNQLIIGPHFIDAAKNVRTLRYSSAPGRHTATASHLTDPANRVYLFTMEDGLYDVNVHDLSFITRYPDNQSDDPFLFGYHGKGAFTGGGKLIVANNGRQDNQGSLTGPTGVLASWDGSLRGAGNANPQYMTAWNEYYRIQHCEVTGPGGIHGAANPTDPVWATGFDTKSVLLRSFENNTWTTWRLPKSSYTHDGTHGWHTEWPRIREISPDKLLMHMHGMFFDFPKTFSATNFAGLSPICSYYKMPVDYCTWEGRLVIAKNDTSQFENNLVSRDQSNFWFGQPEDLKQWGAPQGHGSLWQDEAVANGQASDPFLITGFDNGTLHLKNGGSTPLPLDIELSNGTNTWTLWKSVTLPANSYQYEVLHEMPGTWLRVAARSASSRATAALILSNPYPHTTPASKATDKFAAIADIRDNRSLADGVIRVMPAADLKLEIASKHISPSGTITTGYHQIGGQMILDPVTGAAEATLRTEAATAKDFGSDGASAWITLGSEKLRLPKNDPLYDSEFLSGWARGFRETVTERSMLNCHGTLYEVPRDSAGGRRKMQPITTHNKRITDLTSWRGMLAITGILDTAPASDFVVRSNDGRSALWLGEIDDVWRMGEPRGTGGPWRETAVTANTASDPYLMYGYRSKSLRLSHQFTSPVTFTIEVDFLADNTWSTYGSITVQPGEIFTHVFPEAFQAHWVRMKSSTATTATAQFTYGPATIRDQFLDWARDAGLATGAGRSATAADDSDQDGHPAIFEYLLGTDATAPDRLPLAAGPGRFETVLRSGFPADRLDCILEISETLESWSPRPDLLLPAADQSGIPAGFVRMQADTPPEWNKCFFRLRASVADGP